MPKNTSFEIGFFHEFMPHAFVQTRYSPQSVLDSLQRVTYRFEKIIIRTQAGYLHKTSDCVVVPCLVIEPYRKQRFYIDLRPRPHAILVKVNGFTPVVKTVGVRLALAFVARRLAALDPEASIEKANLAPYIDFFDAAHRSKTTKLAALRYAIRPYLRDMLHKQQASQWVIALDSLAPPLNWHGIYRNPNPVEIEIGPGKGSFLIKESAACPERNFLGIEWASRYLNILTRRISQSFSQNLKIVPADARRVFAEWLAPASVACVHIYFPDPWWKKKHQKHQLFSPEFVADLQRSLSPAGKIFLATDVEDLYADVSQLIDQADSLLACDKRAYRPGANTPPGRTNFEVKKWAMNNPIFESVWQKG